MYIISKAILLSNKSNFLVCSPIIKNSTYGCYSHINMCIFKYLSDLNMKLIHIPKSIRSKDIKRIAFDNYTLYKRIKKCHTQIYIQDNNKQTVLSMRINKI